MNNNKNRLLLCAVLIPAILVSMIFISKLFGARLFVDEHPNNPLPGVNLNTLFENDKQNTSAVKKTNTKSLVGTGLINSGAALNQEKLEKIANTIRQSRASSAGQTELSADKQQELQSLKRNFNANAESDLKAYITYSQFSAAKTGAIISPHLCFSGSRGFFTDLNFNPLKSKDFKAGTYKIKITCGQGNLAKESKALLNLDLNYKAKTHKDFIKYYEVTGTVKNPQRIEIEIYLDQYNGLKIDSIIKKSGKEIPYIWIDKIEVSGPYYEKWPPESHQKILGKSLNTAGGQKP